MRIGRRRPRPDDVSCVAAAADEPDGLRSWAASLPWVREHVDADGATGVCELVIDCLPLGIRRIWLVMGVAPAEREVLAFFTHGDREVSCIRFATPPATASPRDVEAALLLAYESAFTAAGPGG